MGGVLGWFSKSTKSTAEQAGASSLVLRRAKEPDLCIDLDEAGMLGLLIVGEAFSFVHEGWWMFGNANGGGVAVNTDCPMVDVLLRDGNLTAAADNVRDKFVLEFASRPSAVRNASEGVAILTPSDIQHLRASSPEVGVARIKDFPIIL